MAIVGSRDAAGLSEPLSQQASGKSGYAVRRAAVLAIAGMRSPRTIPTLVKLLDGPDAALVVVAARAPGQVAGNSEAALLALGRQVRSARLPVAYASADALRAVADRGAVVNTNVDDAKRLPL